MRERRYEVSNDLGFLKPPSRTTVEDRLWPFDFMVQVAFTSAAVNLPQKEQELYVDREPIEFDQIKPDIQKLVNAGVQEDGFGSQLEDLRSFAILQRLFRSALNGNLGTKFPTLKLAQLTTDTNKAVPYFHTRRWNSGSQLVSGLMVMKDAQRRTDQPWMQKAAMRLPVCEASIRRTLADSTHPGQAQACNFAEFKQAANNSCQAGSDRQSSACVWRAVVRFSELLPELQEVELAFGVVDDERKSSSDSKCPPLAPTNVSVTAKR